MENTRQEPNKKRSHWLRWTLLGLLVLVCLPVLVLTGITLYLTPGRVTSYFNRYCTEYFNAEVRADKVNFTLWSTFPRFCLTIDSLSIVSHGLDSVPGPVRRLLPANADTLATVARLDGDFNLPKALRGKWHFENVKAQGLSVNIVNVNDSVNNFDILPESTDKEFKFPWFTFESIRAGEGGHLRYFDLLTHTDARLSLSEAAVVRDKGKLEDYGINVGGKLWTQVKNFTIFKDVDLSIGGDMALSFDPFKMKFTNFRMQLPSLVGEVNFTYDRDDGASIDNFACNVESLELIAVWRYVSGKYFPQFENIADRLTLTSAVRLTKPYEVSGQPSPALNLEIGNLNIAGPNLDLDIHAVVKDVFGSTPFVEAKVTGELDSQVAERIVPSLQPLQLRGRATADLDLCMQLDDETSLMVRRAAVDGDLSLSRLSGQVSGDRWSGKQVKVHLTGSADDVSTAGFSNGKMDVTADFDSLRYDSPEVRARMRGMHLASAMAVARMPVAKGDNMPVKLSLTARDGHLLFGKDTASMHLAGAQVECNLENLPQLRLHLNADSARYRGHGISTKLAQLDVDFYNAPHKGAVAMHERPQWGDLQTTTYPHTADLWVVHPSEKFRKFVNSRDVTVRLRAKGGEFLNAAYPAHNQVEELDIMVACDSVNLRKLTINSQRQRMTLSGRVKEFRPWIAGDPGAQLQADLKLLIDTLDFNQIAHTYRHGRVLQGKSVSLKRFETGIDPLDTTTLLIPRNLRLNLYAHADEAEYTNLDLYDLGMAVRTADGRAVVDSLRIYASFGKALFNFKYDSSNIQHLLFNAQAQLQDVNVVRFFQKYHSLLEMWPQMANLSGMVNLSVGGSFLIYPSMYMNVNSLQARLAASGLDLKVRQNHFIRHITKMMLIPTDNDLHIKNIYVNGNVHDNLLELYPFDVEFFKYKIRMMGMNDFQGHLNYHIAVLHMPLLPLHFGIHVGGMYSHPTFNFCGTRYDVRDSQERMTVVQNDTVNVISDLKYYFHKFVDNASNSYAPGSAASGTSK